MANSIPHSTSTRRKAKTFLKTISVCILIILLFTCIILTVFLILAVSNDTSANNAEYFGPATKNTAVNKNSAPTETPVFAIFKATALRDTNDEIYTRYDYLATINPDVFKVVLHGTRQMLFSADFEATKRLLTPKQLALLEAQKRRLDGKIPKLYGKISSDGSTNLMLLDKNTKKVQEYMEQQSKKGGKEIKNKKKKKTTNILNSGGEKIISENDRGDIVFQNINYKQNSQMFVKEGYLNATFDFNYIDFLSKLDRLQLYTQFRRWQPKSIFTPFAEYIRNYQNCENINMEPEFYVSYFTRSNGANTDYDIRGDGKAYFIGNSSSASSSSWFGGGVGGSSSGESHNENTSSEKAAYLNINKVFVSEVLRDEDTYGVDTQVISREIISDSSMFVADKVGGSGKSIPRGSEGLGKAFNKPKAAIEFVDFVDIYRKSTEANGELDKITDKTEKLSVMASIGTKTQRRILGNHAAIFMLPIKKEEVDSSLVFKANRKAILKYRANIVDEITRYQTRTAPEPSSHDQRKYAFSSMSSDRFFAKNQRMVNAGKIDEKSMLESLENFDYKKLDAQTLYQQYMMWWSRFDRACVGLDPKFKYVEDKMRLSHCAQVVWSREIVRQDANTIQKFVKLNSEAELRELRGTLDRRNQILESAFTVENSDDGFPPRYYSKIIMQKPALLQKGEEDLWSYVRELWAGGWRIAGTIFYLIF